MKSENVTPFRINIARQELDDLRRRLKDTCWSYPVAGTDWDAGTDPDYLRELVT